MAREARLSKIPIPSENVDRMSGETEPARGAAEYEAELKKYFGLGRGGLPRFDLIFLGVGEDGHTASLFPGSALLDEKNHLVATAYVEKLQAHRLTITVPMINAAARVAFLVAGQSKAAVVKEILGADSHPDGFPAAKVSPADG
jgi:6-phosphogluconolactonase